ncbi:MAG: hypothetical protein ACOH5I_18090 [Oligoflexus sp.]
MKLQLTKLLLLLSCSSPLLADEALKFDYPELLVAPRASDSLLRYARQEQEGQAFNLLQIQIPAVLNFFTGLQVMNEKADAISLRDDPQKNQRLKNTGMAATAVSGAWLALSLSMTLWYEPYSDGVGEVRRYPAKNRREDLIRERIAEEYISKASQLAQRLTHLSAASQGIMSIALMSNSENDQAKLQAGLAGLAALSPYLFQLHWVQNHRQHQQYKKKIYGPIASLQMLPFYEAGRFGQALQLSLRF